MIRIAAAGHRQLCLGQGAELCWMRRAAPLDAAGSAGHLPAARRRRPSKWRCGSARRYADAGDEVHEVLTRYSEALGIAYQIRDDLEDLASASAGPTRGRSRRCRWREALRARAAVTTRAS